jgi:regulator of ribonuclease activity A
MRLSGSEAKYSVLSTPDLSDLNPEAQVLPCQFRLFGKRRALLGAVATVACFEDNSKVKEAVAEPGDGRVLLVDGGGSLAKALTGDKVAQLAMENGWRGMVIVGAARDVEVIDTFDFCVMALGTSPVKTEKLGQGTRGVTLQIGNVRVNEGDYLAGDANGVLVSEHPFNADSTHNAD